MSRVIGDVKGYEDAGYKLGESNSSTALCNCCETYQLVEDLNPIFNSPSKNRSLRVICNQCVEKIRNEQQRQLSLKLED